MKFTPQVEAAAEMFPSPPRSFCESDQHDLFWWATHRGQFMVCRHCAFAYKELSREPVETAWTVFYSQDGSPASAQWMPAE